MKARFVLASLTSVISFLWACAPVFAQRPIPTGQQRPGQQSPQQIANEVAAHQKACADAHANLPAPQSFVVSPIPSTSQTGQVALSWTPVPGADAYKIYRRWNAASYNGVIIATVGGNTIPPFTQVPGSTSSFVQQDLPLFYPVIYTIATVKSATTMIGALKQTILCESPANTHAPITPIAAPNAPVWGFADTHTHQFANLSLSGYFIGNAFGDPQHAFDGDYVGHGIIVEQSTHKTGGYPNFDGWPTWNTLVHQQMYDDWLYRAFLGGLRLMVMHGVNNQTLCMALTGAKSMEIGMVAAGPLGALVAGVGAAFGSSDSGAACNDMAAVDRQIQAARDFESFLNNQCLQGADPPRCPQKGMGWYHIVGSAQEARQTINRGQMAVVLGIEVDRLFDCDATIQGDGRTGGRPCGWPNDAGYVDQQLDTYFKKGVRHLFPSHLANTAFGGMALYEGPISWNFNNRFLNGEWIDAGPCPADFYTIAGVRPLSNAGIKFDFNQELATEAESNLFGLFTGLGIQGNPPHYPYLLSQGGPGGHCNQMGLTDLGKFLIKDMMSRHMIIDIDHMSINSENDTFRITTSAWPLYPVIAGHTGFLGAADTGDDTAHNERSKTDNQLQYIKDSGGLASAGIGVGTAADYSGPSLSKKWFVPKNDCPSSTKAWVQEYLYGISRIAKPPTAEVNDSSINAAVGVATDQPLNSFIGPRLGINGCGGKTYSARLNQAQIINGNTLSVLQAAANDESHDPSRVIYPITVFSPPYSSQFPINQVPVFLQQSQFGNKTWDFNTEGMAHIGLYPDFVQDVLNLGLTAAQLTPLFHSAEQYIQMWQRAEQIHFVLPPPPPPLPQLTSQVCTTLDGKTCEPAPRSIPGGGATPGKLQGSLEALVVVTAASNNAPVSGASVSVSNKVLGVTGANGVAVVTYPVCTRTILPVTVSVKPGGNGPIQKPVSLSQGSPISQPLAVPCSGALTKTGFQTALLAMPTH